MAHEPKPLLTQALNLIRASFTHLDRDFGWKQSESFETNAKLFLARVEAEETGVVPEVTGTVHADLLNALLLYEHEVLHSHDAQEVVKIERTLDPTIFLINDKWLSNIKSKKVYLAY